MFFGKPRSVASIAIAAVLFSLLQPTVASAAATPDAVDAPGVNQVPDTAYTPTDDRPEAPEPEAPTPPPEGSPLAERLAQAKANRDAEIADVRTHESELTVEVGELSTEAVTVPPEQIEELFGNGNTTDPPAPPADTDEGTSGEPSESPSPPDATPSPNPTPSPSPSPSITSSFFAPATALSTPVFSHASTTRAPSMASGPAKASIPTGSACFPGDSPAYNATVDVGGVTQTIMHNRVGAISVTVRNTGSAGWPAGTVLSYQIYDTNQNAVGGRGATTAIDALSAGSSKGMNASVGPVSPGTWYLMWDINVPGVGWLTDRGVCPLSQLTVQNQRPSIGLVSPRLLDTISTRNPYLTVTGSDVDKWPVPSQLRYEFRVCANVELTANCATSGSTTSASWRVPDGALQWASTYYWSASVSDGAASTDLREGTDPASLRFTVVVPQPDPWRQVGNGTGLTNVHGLVLPYGVFVHTEKDAQLNAPNLPLFFERTYSSGAAQTEGALGKGWLTALDASAVRDPSSETITVTYPDGRQERFGLNGSTYVGATNLGMNNRLVRYGDGSVVVTQMSGEVVSFDTGGKLTRINYPGTGSWEIAYSGGQATTITQKPSGMQIRLNWQRIGTTCSSSVRPTKPYLTSISVDRDAGQPPATWQYFYSCDRMYRTSDPLGGSTWYNGSGSSFNGSTPEGRGIPGYSSLGGWRNVGTQYRERKIVLTEPGAANRVVTVNAPPTSGPMNDYLDAYNGWGGLTVSHCEDRNIVNGTEDCGGRFDTLQFDTQGRLRQQFDRASLSTQVSRYWYYGVDGRLYSVSDENDNIVEFSYDAYGNLNSSRSYRDPYTQVTTSSSYRDLSLDPSKPVTRLIGTHITPETSGTVGSEYSEMFHYDSVGHLIRREGPATPGAPSGEDVSYTYTSGAEAATDSEGATIPGRKMPAGALRTQTSAAGTTTFSYDDRGNRTQEVDPAGVVTSRRFDAGGRVLIESTSAPDVRQTVFGYDAEGRLISQRGDCIRNALSLSATRLSTEFSYDRDGLLTSETRRALDCQNSSEVGTPRVTRYEYTSQGQLRQKTDPLGGVTSYTYATSDPTRLASMTDPRGRVTSYLYSLGRLVRVVADVGAKGSGRTTMLKEYSYDPAGRVTWDADALGRTTFYDYTWDDLAYRAQRITGTAPNGANIIQTMWTRAFDGAGRVTSDTVGGRTTASTYDSEGRLYRSVLDPGGLQRSTTTVRDAAGRVVETSIADPRRTERTTFDIGPSGLPTSSKVWLSSSSALTTGIARNARGEVTTIRDPRAATLGGTASNRYTSRSEYDAAGRPTIDVGPQLTVETPANGDKDDASAFSGVQREERRAVGISGYNAFGEVTDQWDEAYGLTRYERDAVGNVVATHPPGYMRPDRQIIQRATRNEYNAAGDLLRKTDERGGVTDYEYDVAGNLVKETGPEVSWLVRPVTTYTYDDANQVVSRTSPTGAVTKYAYDVFGRVVAVTQQERGSSSTVDYTTSYTYNLAGDLTSVTTPAGRTTRFDRNAAGEATAIWYPGRTQPDRFEYDVAGRTTRETDGGGRSIEHVFDLAGRETSTTRVGTDGSRITATNEYDEAGNVIATTNPRGVRTTYTVNALNKRTSVTQPVTSTKSITVEAGFDAVGNRVRTRNGDGVDTWTQYNIWRRPEKVVEGPTDAHPALADRSWAYSYDAAGNQVTELKPGQVRVTRDFDALGRMTKEEGHHDRPSDPQAATRTLGYDLDGRITSASHRNDPLVYTWSDRGLLQTSGFSGGAQTAYGYEADGLVTRRASLSTETLAYDTGGRLSTARGWGALSWNNSVTWTYDLASGDQTGHQTENATVARSYDPQGRVATIDTTQRSPAATPQRTNYTYDANDNVVDKRITGGFFGGGTYRYDLADRLTDWQPRDGDGRLDVIYPRSYAWTGANSSDRQTVNVTNQDWQYDRRGRLTQYVDDQDYGPPAVTAVASDAAGNITKVDTTNGSGHEIRTMEYDALGQLVNDNGTRHEYDAFGRVATSDTVTKPNSGFFTYDGFSSEPAVVPSLTAGYLEHLYRTPDGSLIGSAGPYGTRTLLSDAHGDVNGGFAGSGSATTLTGQEQFDPFGAVFRGSHPSTTGPEQPSAVGFQSDWTNYKTGVSWQGARWYDGNLRTYLSRDDVSFPLRGASSLNLYAYGNANPLKYTDPTGRSSVMEDIFRNTQHFVDDTVRNAQKATSDWWTPDREARWNHAVADVGRELFGISPEEAAARLGGRLLSRFIPGIGWVLTIVDAGAAALVLADGLWGPIQSPGAPGGSGGGSGGPGTTTTGVGAGTTTAGPGSSGAGSSPAPPPPPRPPDPTRHFERAGGTIQSGVDAGTSGIVTIPADADGSTLRPCGLSGTVTSCMTGTTGVVAACASMTSPMRPCAPTQPIAGIPGAMGPAQNTTQNSDTTHTAPEPQTGSSGGGNTIPPGGGGGDTCDADEGPELVEGANGALRNAENGQFARDPAKGPTPAPSGAHGNSRLSDALTWLYRRTSPDGTFQKWGITNDPRRRYTTGQLGEDTLRPFGPGCRSDMMDLERWLVENDPGPMNHEPWTGTGRG